jgi:hypothetical protein
VRTRLLPCLAVIGLCASAIAAAASDTGAAANAHVRPAARNAAQLIETARARSSTVDRLIRDLDATDVIVYVQLSALPHVKTGCTTLSAVTSRGRFLRILINARLHSWAQVPMLGHELQHALEIGRAVDVTTKAKLRELYQLIGIRGAKEDQYETYEAQRIEALVRSEYMARPAAAAIRIARRQPADR